MDSPHVARSPHNKTGESSACSLARGFEVGATAYCRLVLCFAVETRRQRFGPHFIFDRAPKAWAVQISATIAAPRTGRLCRTLFAIGKSVSRLSANRTPLSYKPMCLDIANQASLTTYAEGLPFSEFMRDATDDHTRQLELLQHAGEWLDAYHRTKVSETRIFQPKHAVSYYHDLSERIQSGDLKVAAKPRILHGVERLSELAAKYSDQQTVSAVQYGDFHMRNLIFNGTCLTGINISRNQPAPVGHDIARLLLDDTAILRSSKELETGRSFLQMSLRPFSVAIGWWGPMIQASNFCPMPKF